MPFFLGCYFGTKVRSSLSWKILVICLFKARSIYYNIWSHWRHSKCLAKCIEYLNEKALEPFSTLFLYIVIPLHVSYKGSIFRCSGKDVDLSGSLTFAFFKVSINFINASLRFCKLEDLYIIYILYFLIIYDASHRYNPVIVIASIVSILYLLSTKLCMYEYIPCIYLSIYLSIYQSIYLSICLSVSVRSSPQWH